MYTGNGGTYTDTDTDTLSIEDLAIQKSASDSGITQGATTVWTFDVEASEYSASADNLVIVDTVPDGLEVISSSIPWDSRVEQADGSTVVTWSGDALDLATNGTLTFTLTTTTRQYYREGGLDLDGTGGTDYSPVQAKDSWTNTVVLDGDVIEDPESPTPAARRIHDESSASQEAEPITLLKEVAVPVAGTCGDGSALTWEPGQSSASFGAGDTVCWRISIDAPALLATSNLALTDFRPAGFDYVSFATGAGSDLDFENAAEVTFTEDGQALTWDFVGEGGDLASAHTAVVIVTTTIPDPSIGQIGDIKGNLAKLAYENTPGDIFQLRSQADARGASRWWASSRARARRATSTAARRSPTASP